MNQFIIIFECENDLHTDDLYNLLLDDQDFKDCYLGKELPYQTVIKETNDEPEKLYRLIQEVAAENGFTMMKLIIVEAKSIHQFSNIECIKEKYQDANRI